MARYGEAFKNRAVARLMPPESANAGAVAKEIGVSVQTLERWREDARLEAVITAAAIDDAMWEALRAKKSALAGRQVLLPEHLVAGNVINERARSARVPHG